MKIASRLVLATILGTGLFLAGCGGGKEEAKTPATPAAQTPPAGAPAKPAEGSAGAVPPEDPGAVAMGGRRKPGAKRGAPGALGAGDTAAGPTGASATGGGARGAAKVDGAQIRFESRTVDLGTIWDVGTREFTFSFTNVGRERLVIEAMKASCGCTATSLPKREFESGEGAAIGVAFSPTGSGNQSKTIDIVSNSVQDGVLRLVIEADIRQFVTLEPDVVNFTDVKLGGTHSAIVTVTSADPDLSVEHVEATVTAGGPKGSGRMGNYLTARILGADPASSSPGSAEPRRHQVEVTLGPDAPWGASYGHLEISSRGTLPEGDEVEHTASMHVVATVFDELYADRTMFAVGMLPPGTSFQRNVRLTRPSGAAFAVKSVRVVESTMSGLSARAVPIDEAGTTGYDLVLSGNTGAFRGHVNGVVAIETDVAGEANLEIRFAGAVRDVNK